MGSAFKRCDYNPKKWMIDTTITFEDGSRRHFKRRGYPTKQAAQADFERAKNEFMKKSGFTTIKGTFEELLQLYLDFEKTRLKESSWLARESFFRLYVVPFFNNKQIRNCFTLSELSKFKEHINNLDLSINRKNTILSEMRLFGKFSYKRDLISEKQNRLISLCCEPFPKEITPPSKYTVWTFPQYQKFIQTFDNNDKYKVLFQFLFYTGIRIGELLALQWKDFDEENKTVYIYKSATNDTLSGKAVITTTKTQAGIRSIYINESMFDQLILLKKAYSNNDLESFMFFGQNKPIGRSSVRRKFTEHTIKAKLPYLKIHEIRHTNNTWLLNINQSTSTADMVTKRLGRSSLKVTLDTYYHSDKEEEIDTMDKFKIE